ncbi:hypothetical protein DL93DRAFT_1178975 [Clavulina sp. PMI_390]|nr:hypothetical protein DL93DRAFT_1178975 [Clavulina sp. PMI_390]
MTSIALSSPSLSHSSAHSAPAAIAAAGHRRIDTGASDSDSAHTVTTSATAVENGAASRTSVSVTSKPQEQHQANNNESVIPLPAAPDSLPLPLRNTSTASTPASGNGVDSQTATGGGRAPPFLVQLSAFPLNNPTSLYSPKNPLLPTSSLPNRVHKPSHMAAAAAESTAVFSVPSPAIHQHQHPDPTLDDNDVDSASTPTQPPNFVRVSRFVELFDLVDVSPRARVVFVPHPAGKYTTPVPAYRPAPTVVKKRRKDAVPFPPSTSAVLEAETSRAPPVDDAVNNEQISGNNSAPIATTEPTLIPLPPSRSASPHPVAAQPPIPLSSSSSSEAPYDNNTSSSSIPPPPPRSSLRPAPSRLNSAASSTHSIKRQHSNSFAALSSNPPEDPTPEEPERNPSKSTGRATCR